MLWVLKRTVSMMLKLMGKKIFTIFAENFCLSKAVKMLLYSNVQCIKIGQNPSCGASGKVQTSYNGKKKR